MMSRPFARSLRWMLLGILACAATLGLVAAAPAATADDLPGPGQVEVYGLVGNIQAVDVAANTFTGDFVIGFRWTDPQLHPENTLRLLNASDGSSITTNSGGDPVKGPDGSYTWTERVQGPFSVPFSLTDYPFATQQLAVTFDAPGTMFVATDRPVTMGSVMTLPGYTIGQAALVVAPSTGTDVFGVGDAALARTRISVIVPLESSPMAGTFKVILPIIIVIIATALIFCVPPDHTDARLGLGITALLTLVAMQLGTGLPNLTYLTMLDVIFMSAFAFVVIAMGLVIWNMWTVRGGTEEVVIRRDRISLIVLPLVYLLSNAAIMIYYLR